MRVRAKFTVWRDYEIPEGNEEAVLEALKKGKHPDDINELLSDKDGFMDSEILDETEERIDPWDNQGMSTVEVYGWIDGMPIDIWENGSKEPTVVGLDWSVDDFEERAQENEEEYFETTGNKVILYDRSKFSRALQNMEQNHDASVGINWDTIDMYLESDCRLEEPIPVKEGEEEE